MKKLLTVLFAILSLSAYCQLIDDFSDGDFTNNPTWVGDVDAFTVNTSYQLQLNSSGSDISALCTSIQVPTEVEWSFWVKLPFSPSSNNNARVYLIADNSDLKQDLNGFYIQLGESGSNDAIELVKQSGSQHTVICRGQDGAIASSFTARIKVTRTDDGLWSIYSDMSGNENYILQATGNDNTPIVGQYMGVYCKYTTSNSNKFYFDDFCAGAIQYDTTPPQVLSVKPISDNSIDIVFNEAVTDATAGNANNYKLLPNNITPYQVEVLDHATVRLIFNISFESDLIYKVQIKNISDLVGNVMPQTEVEFAFHSVSAFDVLINEIMADPTPVVGLPDAEYIELYNRTDFPISLDNWKMKIGRYYKDISDFTLAPKSYVILCDDGSVPLLSEYGDIIDFETFSLANSGATLILYDDLGNVIHAVEYTDKWYNSDYKKDGGWSLELIDPNNPCAAQSNWSASVSDLGGTPGSINSIYASNPDTTNPKILRVGVIDEFNVEVWFTETCDSIQIADVNNYSIDNNIGTPLRVILFPPFYNRVQLVLPTALQAGTLYSLQCSQLISDCVGNTFVHTEGAIFAIPTQAAENDIVINEFLFNPFAGSVDWVEIWNVSEKVIDLKTLVLSNYDTSTNAILSYHEISENSLLMLPQQYYVLSTSQEKIKPYYTIQNPDAFIDMNSMPTMNNEDGTIALCAKGGGFIDKVAYTSDMHFALLKDVKGVSLERINPQTSSSQRSNWHSAAETAGFATPGYINSQFSPVAVSDAQLDLEPEVFSPDNDGYNDVLKISVNKIKPGSVVNITIFDSFGQIVRKLTNNELSGTSAVFYWDGLKDNNQKASIGRYIVFVEAYDLEGKVVKLKKTTVLGGKL
ncbi:MAG: lamin tail domain-containing protein [Lentimicrobiaceae bacterium]|nr:lamin tail domain-containing protein [Lentimicrobiaceae bacterium]